MDHDERYKQGGRDWFSSCSNKEDLLHWYSLIDAKELIEKGFVFTRYLATEYHEYEQETVFIKESSLYREEIDIFELFGFPAPKYNVGDWVINEKSGKKDKIINATRLGYVLESGETIERADLDKWKIIEAPAKFNVGDWVVNEKDSTSHQIKDVIKYDEKKLGTEFTLTDGGWISKSEVNNYHLWTIKDAKPGDIVVIQNSTLIYKESNSEGDHISYFAATDVVDGSLLIGPGTCYAKYCYPTTLDQRRYFLQKVKESGYEWDEKNMRLINSTLKEKEEIDAGFTKMMEDDKVKGDIKFILANSDLSKVSTPFSDMLDWLVKKDRLMCCLREANKKIGELVEQNY